MPGKPIELPPEVAKAFVPDMRAFFAAGHNTIKADGIAAQQLYLLKQHYLGKLKLTDVKEGSGRYLPSKAVGVAACPWSIHAALAR